MVQRGGAWAGWGPAQSPPRCDKCGTPQQRNNSQWLKCTITGDRTVHVTKGPWLDALS